MRQHTFSTIGGDLDPEVSPDGTRLYYASNHNSPNYQVFSKRIDGKVLTQITWGKGSQRQPRVSPGGKWLAYATSEMGNWDIRLLDLSKPQAKPRQLVATADDEFGAAWSPDGKWLCYCRYSRYAGDWQIWVLELATGKQMRVGPQVSGLFPRFSPVSSPRWILFQRFRARNPRWATLWYMRGDGTQPTQLLAHPEWGAITPVWDASGEWVLFASVAKTQLARQVLHDHADDIWLIRKDGTGLTRLTSDTAADWSPTWGSSGGEERVFFVSSRSGRPNIYSVRRPR